MTTKIYKHISYGWIAKTVFPIEGDRYIRVTTHKASTTVHSFVVEGNSEISYPFSDFKMTLAKHNITRSTEKAITQAHEAILADLNVEELVKQVKEYYASQEANSDY